MKKKRVSTGSIKGTSKRISSSGGKSSSASRPGSLKGRQVSKKSKSPSKTVKKNKAKIQTPRSSRITKALKAVPKLAAVKIKADIEPLSGAIPRVETITDLPFSYNKTEIVLLPRDPQWAFTYWDFSAETWGWIVSFRERDAGTRSKLRIHQLDHGTYYDKDVHLETKNWYLDLGIPNASFQVELGLLDSQGKFHRIAISNKIKTPRNGPSENVDSDWELTDFEKRHLYGSAKTGRGTGGLSSTVFSSLKRPK